MDKYEVIGLLGEGSFGRVYKAKQIDNSEIVALKVIGKRGRSLKEIKGLRRECEVQRHLNHPNIIKLLDSFETDNEIVVITEFAQKDLNAILGKEVYLSEERVQTIVWDLVSALYYLHSHRVLHRDLKPQNVLLDTRGKSKLCDFGFARNMSTGTHVLTSIKGTPLYMAPELIEEHPYDHTADLWSLGCIIYELLVGTPPFSTTSILHLIKMIRHEEIQFPTFISDDCISFLKGLLQKDPGSRLTWPEILKHSWVRGHILVLEEAPSKPLTRLLSQDTLHAKERQRKSLTQKVQTKLPVVHKNVHKVSNLATSKNLSKENEIKNLDLERLSLEEVKNGNECSSECLESGDTQVKVIETDKDSSPLPLKLEDNLNLSEDCTPIENDEWVVFLQRTIEEVLAGELTSVCQPSLANVCVTPLRNSNASPLVISRVANLFSLPFVVPNVTQDVLDQVQQAYIEIKLIANLVYASKLLLKQRPIDQSDESTLVDDLDDVDDLTALENVYLLICHLVYSNVQFLSQFCDSVAILGASGVFRNLLRLSNGRTRIVADLIAILTHVLRKFPENGDLIDKILIDARADIDFVHMLRHSNSVLRERTCYFLYYLGSESSKSLEQVWSVSMRDTLEALAYDSIENVRNAAESVVEKMEDMPFFKASKNDEESGAKSLTK